MPNAIKADLLPRNTSEEVANLLEMCLFVDPSLKHNESALRNRLFLKEL